MLRRVALKRAEVSEELFATMIRVTRIGELGATLELATEACEEILLVTTNVVPSSQILVSLMMEAICSSETSVLTRPTRCNIPEVRIQHDVYFILSHV
jgi:hypothetical protein